MNFVVQGNENKVKKKPRIVTARKQLTIWAPKCALLILGKNFFAGSFHDRKHFIHQIRVVSVVRGANNLNKNKSRKLEIYFSNRLFPKLPEPSVASS